ncbi:Hypothetical protein NTJ_12982 [Nesidiocoris tenuis]|uniref:Uncharacterized protein n=1 Tax=Nesidiocoris tenuis TaxID=355587 RepID=A0ABN7B6Z5_9HEMI|nr:Hypothetical protein NTJ_12982 [Nesidiocoris tenuis]
MSRNYDRSPGNFNAGSPEFGGFRSPNASSPSKMNYGNWRNQNNRRFRYGNEHNFSPGGRRGGNHFRRGGGNFPRPSGSPDISAYVNRSMLIDPWRHLPNPIDVSKSETPAKPTKDASLSPKTNQDDSQATEESSISCCSDQTVCDLTNDSMSEKNQT